MIEVQTFSFYITDIFIHSFYTQFPNFKDSKLDNWLASSFVARWGLFICCFMTDEADINI